jgi:hypothetical protein
LQIEHDLLKARSPSWKIGTCDSPP